MPARALLPLACLLFTVSGALGLGYQLVWIKKAALIVGTSQVALATVVASFFLGLALGSLFVGRHLRSRHYSPLFVYGLFEVAIGVFALAFPWLFEGVHGAYGLLYPHFAGQAPALFLLRFALLFVLFLVPTFFMGGTLPLLLDGLVDRDQAIGTQTSLLYGLNVLGAVAGVLLTGYLAVPAIGMNGTSIAAGCGNLLIGALALVAFRRVPPAHPPEASASSRAPALYAALSFCSGFAALGYQVAWVRYFGLLRDPSVHLTAVLLACYLAALALGSLLLAGLLRRGAAPLRVLWIAQPLVPVAVFASLGAWRFAAYGFEQLDPGGTFAVRPLWSVLGETADAIFLAPLAQVALVLFVPVTLLGMGLPALIAAATRSSAALRDTSGTLVFWNTLGSSAGSFAAGYLLIPLLGLTHTLLALGVVSLGLGVACAAREAAAAPGRPAARGLAWPGAPAALLAAAALGVLLFAARDDLTARVVRGYAYGSAGGLATLEELVEGPLTTAYVFRSPERTFLGAGHTMLAVAEHRALSYQAVQGHLPALFYPAPGAPERALGIALGSGQSFGALLLHDVESLDVVDISSEVVDLSLRHFEDYNHGLSRDPRVRFHLDDGRHFVDRAPDAYYDVISMEPPPPTAEGVYALYSLEFYRSARRILRENGVLMQWLPLYRVTPEDLRAMLRTQAEVFPHTFVMRAGSGDMMVMSFHTAEPPRFELGWIDERIRIFRGERRVRGHRDAGARHPLDSRLGVLAMMLTGPAEVAALGAGRLHRDDDQSLSYSSGDRALLRRYEVTGPIARLTFAALPLTPWRDLARYFAQPVPARELDAERARTLARFALASPAELRAAELRYQRASEPAAKVSAALAVAALHDRSLAKERVFPWLVRAFAEGVASENDRAEVREIARHGAAVFGPRARAFLASLPEAERGSPLAQEMARALDDAEG